MKPYDKFIIYSQEAEFIYLLIYSFSFAYRTDIFRDSSFLEDLISSI